MDFLTDGKYRITRHLLLWVGLWLGYFLFLNFGSEDLSYSIVLASLIAPIVTGIIYGFSKWLIPLLLLKGKLVRFIILGISGLLLGAMLILLLLILAVGFLPGFEARDLPPLSYNYPFLLITMVLTVAAASFLDLWRKQQQALRQNILLENQLLENNARLKEQELAMLKSQLNPHFLFNALNTVYGSALKGSQQTPDMIMKLSNLLDYSLYQSGKEKVLLSQEVKQIDQYIALESMRFRESLQVNFEQQLAGLDIGIPPLLLLPLVENAFKHGSMKDGVLVIDILLQLDEQDLIFNIKNPIGQPTTHKGIGLENLRRRLEVLYPGSHYLSIGERAGIFEVDLRLKLKKSPPL